MSKEKKCKLMVFGEPCYLEHKFDDVDRATVSRKSAMSKLIVSTVKGLSTKKDNMYVYRVMKTTGKFDGKPRTSYVYLAAMRKLVTCKTVKMRIFDAWIDAADDLVDVLVDCTDAADMLKKEPAK